MAIKLNTAAMQKSKIDESLSMLFGGAAAAAGSSLENIPLSLIDAHPKQYRWSMNEDELNWLANNIAQVGVLQPVSLMRKPDGRYLLLAGHRRSVAAQRAGLKEIPAIVEPYNAARADVIFNATNLGQRQHLLPSEKAYAYADLEQAVGAGHKTSAAIAELTGDNVRMVQRYKRLTNLLTELLKMVDEKAIPVFAGEALASLNYEEQQVLLKVMAQENIRKISLKQAKAIQAASANSGEDLTEGEILAVFHPASYPDWLAEKAMLFLESVEQSAATVTAEWLKEHKGKSYSGCTGGEVEYDATPKGITFWKHFHGESVTLTWAKFAAYCHTLAQAEDKPLVISRAEIAGYLPTEIKGDAEALKYILRTLEQFGNSNE